MSLTDKQRAKVRQFGSEAECNGFDLTEYSEDIADVIGREWRTAPSSIKRECWTAFNEGRHLNREASRHEDGEQAQ